MQNKTKIVASHLTESKSEEISIPGKIIYLKILYPAIYKYNDCNIKSNDFFSIKLATPGVCRICLQPDLDKLNRCITPCFCRGSISKVHKICLETWLAQADSNDCEICKFKYKTKRITK